MRCKGITFCTSNNESVQKKHFLERFYLFIVLFLHKSNGMCNENTPQQHHNITTHLSCCGGRRPPLLYIYRLNYIMYNQCFSLHSAWKTPKNGLKAPVLLDLSQLYTKKAAFLKLFPRNTCTVRLFVIPLHPLSRTN